MMATSIPSIQIEPTCFTQDMKDPKWCKAMFNDFDDFVHNGTWYLVLPIVAQNLVGYEWVFQKNGSLMGPLTDTKLILSLRLPPMS